MLVMLCESGCPVPRAARPWHRLLARLRAARLDRELAAGASPDASLVLALHAQQLVRMRARLGIAASLRRVLASAAQGPGAARLPVPVCGDRVRDCAAELGDLISGLLTAGPVPAAGVAQARLLLSDGGGPLYDRGAPGDLRARVHSAAGALQI